jgi:hypothetical protein
MWRIAVAVLATLGAEGAAIACSCPPPADEMEERAFAERIAQGAVAYVEVDVLSSYDAVRRRGEEVRVHRVLAGRAPKIFRLSHEGEPFSGSCEQFFKVGSRALLVLYPVVGPPRRRGRRYSAGGVCTSALTRSFPLLRKALVAAINRSSGHHTSRPLGLLGTEASWRRGGAHTRSPLRKLAPGCGDYMVPLVQSSAATVMASG